MKGLVHAYYGNGVGKTSRAVGLAIRAAGAGKKVSFIQLMKNDTSSEVEILKKISFISYKCSGSYGFIINKEPTEEEKLLTHTGLLYCFEAYKNKKDVVIVDEILNAYGLGLLEESDVLSLIDQKPKEIELILTGRHCSEKILKKCDYATEFKMIKHPLDQGIKARRGIDY
ncbi:MAG: cob(I)yrinic acid a,c-diamide adenosyltransferase [Candidatus Methanofastidiosia archaeon]